MHEKTDRTSKSKRCRCCVRAKKAFFSGDTHMVNAVNSSKTWGRISMEKATTNKIIFSRDKWMSQFVLVDWGGLRTMYRPWEQFAEAHSWNVMDFPTGKLKFFCGKWIMMVSLYNKTWEGSMNITLQEFYLNRGTLLLTSFVTRGEWITLQKSTKKKYFDANLSLRRMWGKFVSKNPSFKTNRSKMKNKGPVISFSTFRNIFNEELRDVLSFRKAREDTCQYCDEVLTKIDNLLEKPNGRV